LAKLKLDEGVENYNQTLLTALKEIDNALFAYHKAQQQLQATQEAFEQIRLTFEYAMDLYNKGLTSYQNVLDSQRQVLSYENQVLNAENTTLLSFIQLYKALGGGFYSQTL
jgi:outer membrane protein TolC